MSRISLDTYRARYEHLPLLDHKARALLALDICGKAIGRGEYLPARYWAAEAHSQAQQLLQAENAVKGKRRGAVRGVEV